VPPAEAAEEAKEIAIWIDDDELPITCFFVSLSIPTLLKRDIDGCTRPQRLRVNMVDVGNLDLKVYPSPERVKRRPGPSACSSIRWTDPRVR
jgi:hypothetical protein